MDTFTSIYSKQPHTSKKELASTANDKLLHLAFNNSVQASIVSNVSSGKIIIANNAACKLLGYSNQELVTKTRSDIFDINEVSFIKMLLQRTEIGQSTALVKAIKKSGRSISCEITSAVFTDAKGIEKSITTIVDLRARILKQKNIDAKREKKVADNIILALAKSEARLAENNQWIKHIAKASYDVMWDWDIITGEIYVGDSIQEVFGYKVEKNTTNFIDFTGLLLAEEKVAVERKILKALSSRKNSWKDSFQFKRYDGSIASTVSRGSIVRNEDGKAVRLIGAIQDVSRLQELERKLEDQIIIGEKQIAQAMEDARDTERSDIGKELHDNINQLLGASKLYLDMAKKGGQYSEIYLSRSSKYTITAIEEIRKLAKALTTDIIKNLGLCEAIDNVVHDTMEIGAIKISCSLKTFKEDSVSDRFKLNVFRMVQEQLNNILKHSKATEVCINLVQNKKFIILTITDNGVGFDTLKKRKGIGLANIKARAGAYNGISGFISQPDLGCTLTITFPFTEALLQ